MSVKELVEALKINISKVITGKEKELELICGVLLSEGNVLLEDVPGTGKTMLSKALAASIGVDFKRIQFTPDLLPGDLTGINYFNPKEQDFIFRRGAVFTSILLADEINRATPRTQSALLEAMEERQVTVDGTSYSLNKPFFVIATQNPIEGAGTYPLPEAQLDRFTAKLSLGYPKSEEYLTIIHNHCGKEAAPNLEAVCTGSDILRAVEECRSTYIHEDLCKYIVALAEKSRSAEGVALGLSTRAILSTVRLSKAIAKINGRDYVTPEDIKYIFPYIASHRLMLNTGAILSRNRINEIINGILSFVEVPQESWSE